MAAPITSASDDVEQQVTFNIKSSSDAKHVITVLLSSTIADLKQKLAASDLANIPPERQRLIYSGRVLKDPDTVASCKIKDGNTVHLVKGADSNQRQNPANQGGAAAAAPGAGSGAASNVPSSFAAGTGAGDPLAHLTGARYAGFHGLPGADMFGADGGMGAPPNPDQMLRMLEDPNFASQMQEAMNNPAVLNMLRNNPMIRDNPMARAAIENPEMRRMMLNPEMIRMQMQMQRAMGGAEAGQAAFPMPGQTDTTPAAETAAREGAGSGNNSSTTGTAGSGPPPPNPFANLFPGMAGLSPSAATASAQNPFGNLFGAPPAPTGQQQQSAQQQNPFQAMAQQMMQNPQMMQQMMQMFGNGGGMGGMGGMGGGDAAGFNPFAAYGGAGATGRQSPPDNRPPEERYEEQLRSLNEMGFFDFDRNVQALRRSGGSVQGAVEYLFSNP